MENGIMPGLEDTSMQVMPGWVSLEGSGLAGIWNACFPDCRPKSDR